MDLTRENLSIPYQSFDDALSSPLADGSIIATGRGDSGIGSDFNVGKVTDDFFSLPKSEFPLKPLSVFQYVMTGGDTTDIPAMSTPTEILSMPAIQPTPDAIESMIPNLEGEEIVSRPEDSDLNYRFVPTEPMPDARGGADESRGDRTQAMDVAESTGPTSVTVETVREVERETPLPIQTPVSEGSSPPGPIPPARGDVESDAPMSTTIGTREDYPDEILPSEGRTTEEIEPTGTPAAPIRNIDVDRIEPPIQQPPTREEPVRTEPPVPMPETIEQDVVPTPSDSGGDVTTPESPSPITPSATTPEQMSTTPSAPSPVGPGEEPPPTIMPPRMEEEPPLETPSPEVVETSGDQGERIVERVVERPAVEMASPVAPVAPTEATTPPIQSDIEQDVIPEVGPDVTATPTTTTGGSEPNIITREIERNNTVERIVTENVAGGREPSIPPPAPVTTPTPEGEPVTPAVISQGAMEEEVPPVETTREAPENIVVEVPVGGPSPAGEEVPPPSAPIESEAVPAGLETPEYVPPAEPREIENIPTPGPPMRAEPRAETVQPPGPVREENVIATPPGTIEGERPIIETTVINEAATGEGGESELPGYSEPAQAPETRETPTPPAMMPRRPIESPGYEGGTTNRTIVTNVEAAPLPAGSMESEPPTSAGEIERGSGTGWVEGESAAPIYMYVDGGEPGRPNTPVSEMGMMSLENEIRGGGMTREIERIIREEVSAGTGEDEPSETATASPPGPDLSPPDSLNTSSMAYGDVITGVLSQEIEDVVPGVGRSGIVNENLRKEFQKMLDTNTEKMYGAIRDISGEVSKSSSEKMIDDFTEGL